MVPLATMTFLMPIGIVSFVDAYAAPIAFINALVTELSERDPDATQQSLKLFDEYVSLEGLFLKSIAKNQLKRNDEGAVKRGDNC